MAATIPAVNPNPIAQCQLCRSMRQTAFVKFERNIGMLVLRQTRYLQGHLCKTCVGKKFWEFQGLNLLLGPWGIISLIMTPIFLITNTVTYTKAMRQLATAIE